MIPSARLTPFAVMSASVSWRNGCQLRIPTNTGSGTPLRTRCRSSPRAWASVSALEVPLEPACLGERERAERRAAPGHPLVVARHLLEALGRDAPPARDDLEEGSELVGRRGAAERDQEDRVDGSRRTHRTLRSDRSWTMSTRARTCSTGVPGKTPCPRLKMWPGRL